MKITLKQVRQARNLSQNKLARLIGMTLQNIQRIEYGEAKSIPLDTLDKLCEALNCQTGDLLVRIPDNDEQKTESIIKQIIQGLKPMDKQKKVSSSNSSEPEGYIRPCLKSLAQFPESA